MKHTVAVVYALNTDVCRGICVIGTCVEALPIKVIVGAAYNWHTDGCKQYESWITAGAVKGGVAAEAGKAATMAGTTHGNSSFIIASNT